MTTDTRIYTIMDRIEAQLVADGQKIEAIRHYRTNTGMGLKEAKDYIETLPSVSEIKQQQQRLPRHELERSFDELFEVHTKQLKETRQLVWKTDKMFDQREYTAMQERAERAERQTQNALNRLQDAERWQLRATVAERRVHDLEHYITNLTLQGISLSATGCQCSCNSWSE